MTCYWLEEINYIRKSLYGLLLHRYTEQICIYWTLIPSRRVLVPSLFASCIYCIWNKGESSQARRLERYCAILKNIKFMQKCFKNCVLIGRGSMYTLTLFCGNIGRFMLCTLDTSMRNTMAFIFVMTGTSSGNFKNIQSFLLMASNKYNVSSKLALQTN